MTDIATTPRVDGLTIFGIVACALPVAAFSSYSQFMTAHLAGLPLALAWVLPMTTDATAFVATRVWMTPHYTRPVRRYAALIAMACIALSVAGAAIHLAVPNLHWVIVRLIVGGLPSLALAALVHLAAMLSAQRHAVVEKSRPRRSRGATPKTGDAERGATSPVTPTKPPVDLDRATDDPRLVGASVVALDSRNSDKRARMFAYLDAHPSATGAELDREFGTRDYGRGVVRTWKAHRSTASGE